MKVKPVMALQAKEWRGLPGDQDGVTKDSSLEREGARPRQHADGPAALKTH